MTVELRISSPDPQTTLAISRMLGQGLSPNSVLALVGELGSGKTTFIQGLAKGLGIDPKHPVTSPSYNLIHEHPGPLPLYHFDFYRLESVEDVIGLGYEEYFEGQGVSAVEWAEKFPELFPGSTLWIYITTGPDDGRVIRFKGQDSWSQLISRLNRP